MTAKEYKQRERRFVPEFVAQKYPERSAFFQNMAIGPPPEDLWKANPEIPYEYFRRWRFWIDGVVILSDAMILIEGKLRRVLEGLGQLLFYKSLLAETPELAPYANLPIKMVLLVARPDPRVIKFAQALGITVEVYQPAWVQEYLKSLGM